MESLADILKERIEQFNKNPVESLKLKGKERNKEYAKAVKCFQDRINKDRKKDKQEPVPFIAVRMKLSALKEVDDLRWFYRECLKYAGTYPKGSRIRNTFSKAFFGALKCK